MCVCVCVQQHEQRGGVWRRRRRQFADEATSIGMDTNNMSHTSRVVSLIN